MRFFISQGIDTPSVISELTQYEYLKTGSVSNDFYEKARSFRREIDFAFFAAWCGWSYEDYLQSTPVSRRFVRKEIENKIVQLSSIFERAVAVAINNSFSKKRKEKLWQKRSHEKRPPLERKELNALKKAFKKKAPWTPWQRRSNG